MTDTDLYALRLSEDPAFRQTMQDFAESLSRGEYPEAMSLEDFKKRYAAV